MSQIAYEVAEGGRCAVCEKKFTVAELMDFGAPTSPSPLLYLSETGEMVHRTCWYHDETEGATTP